MKISIVLGHPTKGSLNYAIADVAKKFFQNRGDEIFFHDLYEENFDPILPNEEITRGQPPAVLKGCVDRVLRPGVAYEFEETDGGEGVPIGLLKAQCAIIFNTSNTSSEREKNVFGDPLERLWNNCIFKLCGIKKILYSPETV